MLLLSSVIIGFFYIYIQLNIYLFHFFINYFYLFYLKLKSKVFLCHDYKIHISINLLINILLSKVFSESQPLL